MASLAGRYAAAWGKTQRGDERRAGWLGSQRESLVASAARPPPETWPDCRKKRRLGLWGGMGKLVCPCRVGARGARANEFAHATPPMPTQEWRRHLPPVKPPLI